MRTEIIIEMQAPDDRLPKSDNEVAQAMREVILAMGIQKYLERQSRQVDMYTCGLSGFRKAGRKSTYESVRNGHRHEI